MLWCPQLNGNYLRGAVFPLVRSEAQKWQEIESGNEKVFPMPFSGDHEATRKRGGGLKQTWSLRELERALRNNDALSFAISVILGIAFLTRYRYLAH